MQIRHERPSDERALSSLITTAFATADQSDGTEAEIVEKLRAAGALTISLVAIADGDILGHVAFSPITVDDRDVGWYGLGPVAVEPRRQGSGIGAALIRAGLARLREEGAKGCVVLGEPVHYGRFGFRADARLSYPGPPPQYFQALSFGDDMPVGTVAYHPAFG